MRSWIGHHSVFDPAGWTIRAELEQRWKQLHEDILGWVV